MAFTNFKSIEDVVEQYHIHYDKVSFVLLKPIRKPPKILRDTIQFNIEETAYDISEAALCESLIFPILQAGWKVFKNDLFLWSHRSIQADEILTGIPDYLIAKRSALGRVLGMPLLTTVEAKKDNFAEGWAQCAAQMLALQKLNQVSNDSNKPYIVFGMVTNGESWEMAQLRNNRLTKETHIFTVSELDKLWTAIVFILNECKNQLSQN